MVYLIFMWFVMGVGGMILDRIIEQKGKEQVLETWTNYPQWSLGLKISSAGVVGFIITLIVISLK